MLLNDWGTVRMTVATVSVAVMLVVPSHAADAVCTGDCNGQDGVLINEVVASVNIFLELAAVSSCRNADRDGNGLVDIAEVVAAVNSFLTPETCSMVFTPTQPSGPTPTNTLPPTNTPTASSTPTPTTSLGPPLGLRVFSLGSKSAFTSSLLPGGSLGTPMGTLMLDAGGKDSSGRATVTLANPGTLIRTDLSAGTLTLCTKLDSCTGTLYCNGGTDVDVLNSLDSLRAGLQCVRDGTNSCPASAPTPPVCCSNACEGVGVGSGNSPQQTSPPPGTPTPSTAGAMLLICQQRSVPVRPLCEGAGPCCANVDFSTASPATQYYTTGIDRCQVLDHCAGSGAPASTVPKITKKGTNFDCSNWTTENGVGVLAFTIPAEEGDSQIKGDGAQAGLWSDQ